MAILIPVNYGTRCYPRYICPKLQEISAHFDTDGIAPVANYSLHTEYSYGPRKFCNSCLKGLENIKEANVKGVPQLWRSVKWAEEFAVYLKRLIGDRLPPDIIEIHPPFNDYCPSVRDFYDSYSYFEDAIHSVFPKVKIFLENRAGSVYSHGKFLVSTVDSLIELTAVAGPAEKLDIVLDLPQLFTAHHFKFPKAAKDRIRDLFRELKLIREHIKGIHLWGKKPGATGRIVAHQGNLDDYFADKEIKKLVLDCLCKLLDDNMPRYFVPEVNSNDGDLENIIGDLVDAGFAFV